MEYNFLMEQNKEYQNLYKKYNEILNEKRENLKKINNKTIENMDLEKLNYSQLKELMDLISYNIDDNLKEKLNNAYLYKKPYTNKVVEKMDFLDRDRKIQLDVNLSYFKNRYMTHHFWTKIRATEEIKNKILDILLEEGYIREDYKLHCLKCRDYMALLKEKDLNEIKEYEELKLKIVNYEKNCENKELTDEEEKQIDELYDKYYDIEESNHPLIHYCNNCDYENEFENLKEILKFTTKTYYIK